MNPEKSWRQCASSRPRCSTIQRKALSLGSGSIAKGGRSSTESALSPPPCIPASPRVDLFVRSARTCYQICLTWVTSRGRHGDDDGGLQNPRGLHQEHDIREARLAGDARGGKVRNLEVGPCRAGPVSRVRPKTAGQTAAKEVGGLCRRSNTSANTMTCRRPRSGRLSAGRSAKPFRRLPTSSLHDAGLEERG